MGFQLFNIWKQSVAPPTDVLAPVSKIHCKLVLPYHLDVVVARLFQMMSYRRKNYNYIPIFGKHCRNKQHTIAYKQNGAAMG